MYVHWGGGGGTLTCLILEVWKSVCCQRSPAWSGGSKMKHQGSNQSKFAYLFIPSPSWNSDEMLLKEDHSFTRFSHLIRLETPSLHSVPPEGQDAVLKADCRNMKSVAELLVVSGIKPLFVYCLYLWPLSGNWRWALPITSCWISTSPGDSLSLYILQKDKRKYAPLIKYSKIRKAITQWVKIHVTHCPDRPG